MNMKLREHIDALFSEAPNNHKTVEIKEEILQNLFARYKDLISQGKSEEAAYNITIAGIGDLSGLIEELKEKAGERDDFAYGQSWERYRRQSAIIIPIAIVLFIICVVPLFLFNGSIGITLLFVIAAAATGLLVYNDLSKPGPRKSDETMVEEFKKWRDSSSQKAKLTSSISSAIWCLTLALYFLISFMTGAWYITWIIFLIAGAINNIVKAVFDLGK